MGAKLSVAVLCLLATWRAYTVLAVELTFSRSGENANRITLSCLIDTFPAPSPTFYTIIPGSSQRLRVDSSMVQDYQPGDGQDIVFTLTPETEAKFSCESQGNESSSVLLAGGSIYYSYKYTGKPLKLKRGYIVPVTHSPRQLVAVCYEWSNCPHGLIVFQSLQIVWYFCIDTPLHSPSSQFMPYLQTFQHCTVFCKASRDLEWKLRLCVWNPHCPEIPYANTLFFPLHCGTVTIV